MTKRELTDAEKEIIKKNIVFIESTLEYDNAIAKQVDVQIEIAPILYNHQIKEMERKRIGLQAEIDEMNNSLVILNDQLENGVEVKDDDNKDKSTN